ncbi:hypothetical protein [Thiohalocapsa sp. ML1]|uniref:hypothetical protein n=1 Tax=Thiohalocapsa sp. ML1 TaxID=1431688 RepID=UPI0007322E96|nr:hypothetical protein [Thiohalocapsa sp. ML1]
MPGDAPACAPPPWRLAYSTSSDAVGGKPVDILHDFYLPALRRAVRYDRVAGYFRSSSLAAASQGFSAFVGNGGKARMVVGADLHPDDVAAVLAGDEARLAARLTAELVASEQWPEAERRGVALLAWMSQRREHRRPSRLDRRRKPRARGCRRGAFRAHLGEQEPEPRGADAAGCGANAWCNTRRALRVRLRSMAAASCP